LVLEGAQPGKAGRFHVLKNDQEGALEVMGADNRMMDVVKAVTEIQREHRKDPQQGYEKLMACVSPLMSEADPAVPKALLIRLVVDALCMFHHYDEAEALVIQLTELDDDSPQGWMYASSFYLHHKPDGAKAIAMAQVAIDVALRTGNFVVSSYEALCIAARESSDYTLFEQSLQKALDHQRGEFNHDVRLVKGLLAGIPEGAVDSGLAERYRQKVAEY
jgi:hypothetical protein